jgi:hypothetical protein
VRSTANDLCDMSCHPLVINTIASRLAHPVASSLKMSGDHSVGPLSLGIHPGECPMTSQDLSGRRISPIAAQHHPPSHLHHTSIQASVDDGAPFKGCTSIPGNHQEVPRPFFLLHTPRRLRNVIRRCICIPGHRPRPALMAAHPSRGAHPSL